MAATFMADAAVLAPVTDADRAAATVYLAKARAATLPELAAADHGISRAAVMGAGTMGAGIAMALAAIGVDVVILDADFANVERAIGRIADDYARMVKRGGLTAADAEARQARIQPAASLAEIGPVDLTVEAVFEDMDIKRQVMAALEGAASAGTILATNTSTLDIDQIAATVGRPENLIGTHFFVPAQTTPLLEIVPGAATSPAVVERVKAMAAAMGKTAVVAGICDGFIGNSMFDQYCRQAMFMLEEGATPWQIDDALERWGMTIGPFRTFDLIGNEVPWATRKRRVVAGATDPQPLIGDILCEKGWYGRKTGSGWYRYDTGGRRAEPNPDVVALIADYGRDKGIAPRVITDGEIVGRCVLALAQTGGRLLADGIAQRAGDIDLVSVTGYGFPADRGGPLFFARQLGKEALTGLFADYAARHGDPAFWAWPPMQERTGQGWHCGENALSLQRNNEQ